MSLKLFASFAGFAGTIGGVAGTTYYFLSTNSSLKEITQAHKDVESIELSLSCSKDISGTPTENDDLTFNWIGKISKEQWNKLKQKQSVKVTGDFWLRANKNADEISKFARAGEKDIYLTSQLGNQNRLHITLGKSTSGSDFMNSIKFWCSSKEGKLEITRNGSDDGFMSFIEMTAIDPKTLSSNKQVEMKVSLVNCQDDEDKKTTSCDLQLNSSSGNNWSIKVSDKTKYTFTKHFY